MIGRRVGAKWWIGALMIAWGSICIAHIAIRSSTTFFALRLLLGIAEAGFTPTAFYYMSTFYPKFSLGFRMGLFSGMFSIAGAFAGLLAYGILHLETSMLQGWQMLFLLEGVLTVLVAILALTLLPADVTHVWFLTKKERAHAVYRMERDLQMFADTDTQQFGSREDTVVHGVESPLTGANHSALWRDVQDVLKDWRKLLIIVCNILSVLVRLYTVPFLPSISY